jgi:hypothetical protein
LCVLKGKNKKFKKMCVFEGLYFFMGVFGKGGKSLKKRKKKCGGGFIFFKFVGGVYFCCFFVFFGFF